jgi:CheY-like chemotaxis protein
MLVDDNRHVRAIVTMLLDAVGIKQIKEVSDGQQALDILQQWPADLAIVDFQMAGLDGVAFTREVRNSPDSRNPYLPIIMMTGHSERSRVIEARDAGVTEFLVKPVTAKNLMNRLQGVIFKPRPFIRTASYFGPDRRRKDDPSYDGPKRRSTDEGAVNPAWDTSDEIAWDDAVGS